MFTIFKVFLYLLALFTAGAATAQEPGDNSLADTGAAAKLSVNAAVDEAIQNNLSLLAERLSLTIAEAAAITASLRPNPVLSLSSERIDFGHGVFNNKAAGGAPEFSVRVDVPFELGNKRELRTETASFEKQIAAVRLLDSVRKLKLDVAMGCIDVIEAKAKLALAVDNLRTFEELVRLNQTKVNSGSMATQELTRSRVAMLQFRNSVKRAEIDLLTTKTRLQNLLGRKTPVDEFDIDGELKTPLNANDQDLLALQEKAFAARPDLQTQERTQARSQAELKLQIAQSIVDYTLGVEYRRYATNVQASSNYAGFFFSVPLPFFSRNQGEIARVRGEQEQLVKQVVAVKAQVASEVKTAYQEMRAARELLQSIEADLLQPARQARDNSAYIYRAGATTLVELLDAQRAFNETMQTYYEAQGAYRRAVLRLNNSVGEEVVQ
jgi:outer membrane protein, heavy metal efflux system